MSSFKAFMMEIGAENVLFAFNNLQDIYEYLSVLNVSADVSDEMRSVFLRLSGRMIELIRILFSPASES